MFFTLSTLFLMAASPDLIVATADVDGLKNAVLVDACPADAYTAGHIPGALNVSVAALSETRDGVAGMLKPLDQVRKALGDAGVDPEKRVVVYSAMDKASDLSTAARLFWVLEYVGYKRVAVLDGGLAKWTAENRAVERGPSAATPITLPEMSTQGSRLATAANVDLFINGHYGTVVDARSPEYYRGEKKADVVREAGHIPTAVNLPVDTCVGDAGTLKSPEELRTMATTTGIDKKLPVVTYCNTGRSASAAYLILRILGHENVAMYDGSMADWTASGTHRTEKTDQQPEQKPESK